MQMNGDFEQKKKKKAWAPRVMTRPQGAYCFRVIVQELLWGRAC